MLRIPLEGDTIQIGNNVLNYIVHTVGTNKSDSIRIRQTHFSDLPRIQLQRDHELSKETGSPSSCIPQVMQIIFTFQHPQLMSKDKQHNWHRHCLFVCNPLGGKSIDHLLILYLFTKYSTSMLMSLCSGSRDHFDGWLVIKC